jgi:hypothetical protein
MPLFFLQATDPSDSNIVRYFTLLIFYFILSGRATIDILDYLVRSTVHLGNTAPRLFSASRIAAILSWLCSRRLRWEKVSEVAIFRSRIGDSQVNGAKGSQYEIPEQDSGLRVRG